MAVALPVGVRSASLWLVPAVALCALALALSARFDMRRVAVVLTVAWLASSWTSLRGLRSDRGLTLDGLSERTGVSRSMISLIERGESSPTAAVLDKLAAGLGVTLASLFAEKDSQSASPLARRAEP